MVLTSSMVGMLWLGALTASAEAVPPPPVDPIHTRQEAFAIPFQTEQAAAGTRLEVHLFVSNDRGARWSHYQTVESTRERFAFRAATDGEYWFRTQTTPVGTTVATPGGAPEMIVVVDTQPPELECNLVRTPDGQVAAMWLAIDLHIDRSKTTLHYRQPQGSWQQVSTSGSSFGSPSERHHGQSVWRPSEREQPLEVRAEASDRAGNVVVVTRQLYPNGQSPSGSGEPSTSLAAPTTQEASTTPIVLSESSQNPAEWSTEQRNTYPHNLSQRPTGQPAQLTSQGNQPPSQRPAWNQPPSQQPQAPERPAYQPQWGTPSLPLAASTNPPEGSTAQQGMPTEQAGVPRLPGPSLSEAQGGWRPAAPRDLSSHRPIEPQPVPFDERPPVRSTIESVPPAVPSEPQPPFASSAGPTSATSTPSQMRHSLREAAGAQATLDRRMTNSLRFYLEYAVESVGPAGIASAELWGTEDQGQTWHCWGSDADRQSPFLVEVDRQGTYGFCIVVESASGLSGHVPQTGQTPDVWIGIDTTLPEAQLTSARYGSGSETGQLRVEWMASDDHLTEQPVSLSYSENAEGPWTTIISGLANTGQYRWHVPTEVPREIFLRLEVRDAAGNVGSDQLGRPLALDGLRPRALIQGVRPVQ